MKSSLDVRRRYILIAVGSLLLNAVAFSAIGPSPVLSLFLACIAGLASIRIVARRAHHELSTLFIGSIVMLIVAILIVLLDVVFMIMPSV